MLRWRPRHRHAHRTTLRRRTVHLRRRPAHIALALCLALGGLVAGCRPAARASDGANAVGTWALAPNARVERVVDGDTIIVIMDAPANARERVRLIGIDTPETKKPDSPVECFGPEASERTTELLPADTPVHLERDLVARDDYGRLLAYVYRASDGLFVNLALLDGGFARTLRIVPNTVHASEFAAAAARARSAGTGLWGSCAG